MNAAEDRSRLEPPSPRGILTSDQLKKITKYQRDGDLKRHLEKEGIPYFEGKDGVWTTMELITLAGRRKLGLDQAANHDDGEYL